MSGGHPERFGFVDVKLREADFFFEKLASTAEPVENRSYFASAFASAGRSVSFALRSALNGADGFEEWWAIRGPAIPGATYFKELRNAMNKEGANPVFAFEGDTELFAVPWYAEKISEGDLLETDFVTAAREYMKGLAQAVFEVYRDFGHLIDPEVAWTPDGAVRAGITIEEIEAEVFGGPLPWQAPSLAARFARARQGATMPDIDDLLVKWLGHDRRGRVQKARIPGSGVSAKKPPTPPTDDEL